MKYFFLVSVLLFLSIMVNAQSLGTKRSTTLKLVSYECGDFCYIELKDNKNGEVYTFNEVDDKTNDHGIFEQIQREYYAAGEKPGKYTGKSFAAVVEYRLTDEYLPAQSVEEAPKKSGKKLKKWMLSEFNWMTVRQTQTKPVSGNNNSSLSYLSANGKLNFRSDCYIIVEGSFKEESDAQNRVADLRSAGSIDVGYIWIPDYPSLSGKPFFATFFGPYHDLTSCKRELKHYPKDHKFYYAKMVSMRPMNQTEIRYEMK